ncbi:DUF3775 domain-containing protein [Paracoccus sp. (in: a-proteobacteria)]|uniref:DUF3775 domain-containing protein n=1 Tax=Paracoccus sp. TaxID=267 RepID=UPI002896CB59|nr:DUF3775 domain-containing protein [Paracoccus sp. (in: a-proteobacteria)]
MLEITADKIAYVVLRAREYQSGINAWAHQGSRRQHGARTELHEFLDGLNDDEKAGLVAVMWIGRETFGPEELSEAITTARTERGDRAEDYLMAEPQLADFLESGMEALGLSPEDETDAVQHPV